MSHIRFISKINKGCGKNGPYEDIKKQQYFRLVFRTSFAWEMKFRNILQNTQNQYLSRRFT